MKTPIKFTRSFPAKDSARAEVPAKIIIDKGTFFIFYLVQFLRGQTVYAHYFFAVKSIECLGFVNIKIESDFGDERFAFEVERVGDQLIGKNIALGIFLERAVFIRTGADRFQFKISQLEIICRD